MKKYYRMTIESKAVPVLRAAVLATPGKACRELAASVGYTYAHAVAVLTLLRKAGDILPVRAMGGQTQWWPADQAAEQITKWRAMRKEHDKKRKAANRKANPTTRSDRIHIGCPSAVKVLEAIRATPGIQSPQMAEQTGCALSHVKNVLTVIRAAGLAVMIPVNAKTRHWYTQDVAGPHLEAWEARRRNRSTPKPKAPTKRDKIAELSRHPEGVRMSAIVAALGISGNLAGRHVGKMMLQGRLYRAERAGARLRWFDAAERAEAWSAMPAMEPSEWAAPRRNAWAVIERKPKPIRAPKLVAIGGRIKNSTRQPSKAPPKLAGSDQGKNQVIKAKPGVDATVTLKSKPSDLRGAVDYSKAKITIDSTPKYDARYQVAPGSVVVGEFSRQWRELRGAA